MPELTAINNTHTANTASGVHECLYFLVQQARARRNRDTRPVDVFRTFPVSIVYGYGNVGAGQLITLGDDLDIIPTQWDRVRRRRWWDVSRTASKQMLLPFAEHARVRIMNINRYSHATEIVIQIGSNPCDQLSLTALRDQDAAPGPCTIRAIRIHNVDHSETVPPMRPTAAQAVHVAYPVDGAVAMSTRLRTRGNSPYAQMVNNEVEDAPEPPIDAPERPLDLGSHIDWFSDDVPARMERAEVQERPVCDESAVVRPGPPCRPVRGWGWHAEVPPTPDAPIQEVPRSRRVPATVPIREIVTREQIERDTREYQRNREVPSIRRSARAYTRRATRTAVPIREIVTREDVDREARNHGVRPQLRAAPIETRDMERLQARMVRDVDRAVAYGAHSHTLGRPGNNDT